MTDLQTSIGDFQFDNVFMNASGVRCYTEEDLDALAQSDAGTFVTKSATQAKTPRQSQPALCSTRTRLYQFDGLT